MGDSESAAEIHHVGLTVSDLDRSAAFYRDLLDLRDVARNRLDGEAISGQTLLPGTVIDVALLAGSNTLLELLCYRHPAPRPYALRPCDAGAAHVCIVVEDIEARVDALQRAGVALPSGPARLMHDDTWMIYVRDPDGIIVELIQPTAALSLGTLLARRAGTSRV
jgi:catechol 2,3-dioxygenase-like lactoylglutathione lyase family enzyme